MTRPGTWTSFPNLFSLSCVLLTAANYFAPMADLDFTWQIRTGELIASMGSIRPPESFSYTIAGRSVPDFEWLYELMLWYVWSAFGHGGLKLVKTILVITPMCLLARRLQKEGVAWYGIVLSLLAAVLVVSPAWNLRPLYFTTIGLLLLSGWLRDHCLARRPLPWYLPLAMAVWANLHPGVIAGQGVLAGCIAWECANQRLRFNRPMSQSWIHRLTWIGSLGLAATLIGPNPIERLLYPFRPELRHPIQQIFTEMQPLSRYVLTPPYVGGLAYLVAALALLTIVLRLRDYRLWEISLLAGLAFLANTAVRSLQDWILVMLALAVPHLTALTKHWLILRQVSRSSHAGSADSFLIGSARILMHMDRFAKRILGSWPFRLQPYWLLGSAVIIAVLSVTPRLGSRVPVQDSREWPAAALAWIEEHGIEGRFFAPPDFGSYLGWKRGDKARCYVDTRGFFFPPLLIEDSHYLPSFLPGWQERLDRVCSHGTDYFLLETAGPRGALWRQLEPHVPRPLYLDDKTVLLTVGQVREAAALLQPRLARREGSSPAIEARASRR